VPTPSDFGRQGKPPTAPGMLDYLARCCHDSGWSVEAMHRHDPVVAHLPALQMAIMPATRATDPGMIISLALSAAHRLDAPRRVRDAMLAVVRLTGRPAERIRFPSRRRGITRTTRSGRLRDRSPQRSTDDAAHRPSS